MTLLLAIGAFVLGVAIVIVATNRLLEGLVGIARAARVAPFVASAVLSGMEAENVAVGLAAGQRGVSEVALGTAFGGAIFLLCIAVGVGALIAPLRVSLPRGAVLMVPAAAVLAGIPIAFSPTPRWTGLLLLVAFAVAMAFLISMSRGHRFMENEEVREAGEKPRSLRAVILLTVVGIGLMAAGGELVAYGAEGLIKGVGLSAGLFGMVITPAAIEAEEIVRQVVPAQRGYDDVSAGNTIGTVLYFVLFNLGLVALLTPVSVPALVRMLDWPYLVGSSVIVAVLLLRGRLGRIEGGILAVLGLVYAGLHVVLH
ncbi:MAG: sodium:calcium antiporter [Candidatus Dormibacteria bacterium]